MDSNGPSLPVPEFGPLQGVRILSTGSMIAQPFAAELAAEMGAQVIQVERPGGGDFMWRKLDFPVDGPDGAAIALGWMQDHRNTFHITLDLASDEGRELFLDLVKKVDIWMESSKPGVYAQWGLDDATALAANPRLVITHVSGYGQEGHPDYLGRASYDFIAQGFAGLMHINGFPEPEPPVRMVPSMGDFISALFCLWSSLAGYISAQNTGRGQAVDVAMHEATHRLLGGTMMAYFEKGIVRTRGGNRATAFQPYDVYKAQDGWVIIAAIGNVFDRVCKVIGLDPSDEKWRVAHVDIESPEGIEFDALLRGWVEGRTVDETVEAMNDARVACGPIMTASDIAQDPHYQARNVHIEWEDLQLGRKVKGTGVVPKFSGTPGEIWRGSVPAGHDNQTVFGDWLGVTSETLEGLKSKGII